MIEFLTAPANAPFTIALCVMAGLAILELISMIAGFALSHAVDSAIPGLDHDVDVDLDFNHDGHVSGGESFLGWLHVGQVPILILFLLLLMGFGLGGVLTQWAALNLMGKPLGLAVAVPLAIVLGMLAIHFFGAATRRFVLKDESTAISAESLVGCSAVITLGTTRKGTPTQAKLKDGHGQNHYVLVEPLNEGSEFHPGESVLLIERIGHKYLVIEDSMEAILSFGANTPSAEDRQPKTNA